VTQEQSADILTLPLL